MRVQRFSWNLRIMWKLSLAETIPHHVSVSPYMSCSVKTSKPCQCHIECLPQIGNTWYFLFVLDISVTYTNVWRHYEEASMKPVCQLFSQDVEETKMNSRVSSYRSCRTATSIKNNPNTGIEKKKDVLLVICLTWIRCRLCCSPLWFLGLPFC